MSEGKAGQFYNPNRRSLLRGTAMLAGASILPAADASRVASADQRSGSAPTVIAGAGKAEVNTESGRIAGFIRNGIFTFKGIPYGATTAGEARFQPPKKAAHWQGTRSCRQYGAVAPQAARSGTANNDEEAFLFDWDDGVQRVYRQGESEDCLRLNVWTPGLGDGRKRPVMVWIHGGGFSFGSSHEQPSYDGENLSRRGDVVLVSINHRLNVFGFLDLSTFGVQYQRSANVGMLDIVRALEWVRDNITAFGGHPKCVTIFGQSGGGSKVSMLMGMPAAQGLFHRAIVESASKVTPGSQEASRKLGQAVVAELGLGAGEIHKLHDVPMLTLLSASEAALRKTNPPSKTKTLRAVVERVGFGPVMDGVTLPEMNFSPNAPAMSAEVPMIIGTTLNEFFHGLNHPEYEAMTNEELERRARELIGQKSSDVLAAFRKRIPNANPFDIWSRLSASPVREVALRQCEAKASLRSAPVYNYWFTWQTPVLDGRPRAFHCAEIAFVFDNADLCDTMTGGGKHARQLAAQMSDAWTHFARTGNPNHAGIPLWSAYTSKNPSTMIFDTPVLATVGIDRDEQAAISNV